MPASERALGVGAGRPRKPRMKALVVVVHAVACGTLLLASPSRVGADEEAVTSAIPSPLSMPDALRLFRERGFDLLLADSSVASAQGDLKIARAFPNPLVGGGGGYTWKYNPGKCESGGCSRHPWNANLSDQGLLFDLLIGKRRLKVDVAQQALEAVRLSRADANRVLTAMLKQQY